jgi:MFS superfamily sulfate permease-like transporter
LAAVVIVAAWTLLDVGTMVWLWRRRRSEFLLAVAALLGVAVFGALPGIGIAVALSLGDFVRRAWRPYDAVLGRVTGRKGYHDLDRHPEAVQIPGLVLYRFDAPLFFANAETFSDRLLGAIDQRDAPVRWVIVAAEPITDIDTTAADVLAELLDRLEARDVQLAFAELKGPVKDTLRSYGLLDRIGEDHLFPTIGTAVDGYVSATGAPWTDWSDEGPGLP